MIRLNCKGMTITEICVALMIMALGMVSVLSLFPKALHTTQSIMGKTNGAMAAQSAAATLMYRSQCNNSHLPYPFGGNWTSNYGSAASGSWPGDLSSTPDLIGRIRNVKATYVDISSDSEEDLSLTGLNPAIGSRYFMLVRSGRGKGMLYRVSSGSNGSITIGTNAADDGVESEAWIEIIGPNCVGPESVVTDKNMDVYSWLAVVNSADPSIVDGLHRTYIFVYARDANNLASDLSNINDFQPVCHLVTDLAE